ncbi:MAG: hypothetical protein JO196_08210 [Hyphomicrobiales bacterium]|nr:hypothetical protein [Hyphomicrobiales bacterium]MBV9751155.1 hypothetical protein [Hyphomicrobiales bacterium]
MKRPSNDDAIRLRASGERGREGVGIDWALIRAVYMRFVGLAWLVKGLYHGATILGVFGPSFATLDMTGQVSAAFSAIGDCIAGVGLWLTVSWGAVTWIVVALGEMAFAISGGAEPASALAVLVPILLYVVVTFMRRRQAARL